MIRLADYVIETLVDHGVRHAFMVTGGGAMHLNDAVGRCARLKYICCHHEQACAMAAESYARVTGRPALVQVTTGPGSINALNGVFGAWTDSMPMIIVSGQVKRETCMAFQEVPGLRQLGDQEVDIISMARGITKSAVLLRSAEDIAYELDKAVYLATTGRPGPCWIDIPIDLQGAQIDPTTLRRFDPTREPALYDGALVRQQMPAILEKLSMAERPVILVGSGVRIAGALTIFEEVIDLLGIPIVEAWSAPDALPTEHSLFCGRAGTIGDRAGNFAVQNADVLLILGSRLPLRQVSYNWRAFARHAYKIAVDIDLAEFPKPTAKIDFPVHSDARFFLEALLKEMGQNSFPKQKFGKWLAWCRERVAKYPVVLPRHQSRAGALNPYAFLDDLIRTLDEGDVMICGDGTASVVPYQVAQIKRGQRLYANAGDASMGYDLPGSIGAAVALEGRQRVIAFAGDGSIQMNLQELQTLAHHQFPVKLFVLNNRGYLSIRSTQTNYFEGRLVGEGPASGVTFPDFGKLAAAYGLPYQRIDQEDYLPAVRKALETPGPFISEVMLDPDQAFEPKLSSKTLPDGRIVSAPLEDLYPFLTREEMLSNLLVPPMEEI
jgi:acetolactate synthase-1/2/3 large subunit